MTPPARRSAPHHPGRAFYHRMTGRRIDEEHRASTPLELLFDLCFVVAVAAAGNALHHSLAVHHYPHGVLAYASVFFTIWWAWMNFTWFASAYDTDDGLYRLTTLVQIVGALVLAAGVPRAFDHGDFRAVTLGYVVMRVALVAQWLRAAHGDRERRATALKFAVGITAVQVAWVARLAAPHALGWPLFVAVALADLAVPVVAERGNTTPYHREHIAERYGLFTLIVLGESVFAATTAVIGALYSGRLLGLAACGLVVVFAMWWLYFDRPAAVLLTSSRIAFAWGYGHYFGFGSAAAVGAGLAANADGHLSRHAGGLVVAVPVAVFLATVWALQVCPHRSGTANLAFPAAAVLCVGAGFAPQPLVWVAAILAALVGATSSRFRTATR